MHLQVAASAAAALAASSVALNTVNNAFAQSARETATTLYAIATQQLGSSSTACPSSVRHISLPVSGSDADAG